MSPQTSLRRPLVYAALLALVASAAAFYRLGAGTLDGDEAAFASTTDRMLATGDLVVPYIGDMVHLNAAPLYNWLTVAVRPFFDEGPLWYRVWSAAFGVGCVMLTFALGAALFRAEVGLLAGLFLTFNRDFLCCHGVRFGAMDTLTAFFLSGAVLAYVALLTRERRWPLWALLGVCIGLAWLSKPPVFGAFFLGTLGLYHLVTARDESVTRRLAGPLLALAVGVAVASAWYAALWLRVGDAAMHQLFVFNSVERALDAQHRDFRCCHRSLHHASVSFKLMEAALIAAAVWWSRGEGRRRRGAVLVVAVAFLAALTAAGKALNYIYYAYPLLCVVLAAVLLEGVPRLVARVRPALGVRAAGVGVALAVVALLGDVGRVVATLRGPAPDHPPLAVYRRAERGECLYVLFDFPGADRLATPGGSGHNFEDIYYGSRMPGAVRVDSLSELARLLAERRPTVVVLPPLGAPTPAMAAVQGLGPETRRDLGVWKNTTYPTLTFHGAAAKLGLDDLVGPVRKGG